MTDLRRRIDELIRKWNLLIEETIETETSVLAFGVRVDQPIVLKVIKSEGDEWNSGNILAAFAGRGVVRVHEYVPGAVLLERAVPGESLVRRAIDGSDQDATAIVADVIRRMSAVDPPEGCATVQDWAKGFERYVGTGDQRIPTALVMDAQQCYLELAASQTRTRLLHGDLHHYNVLSDAQRGWLAIDPKGVVGEIEYQVGALFRNPIEDPDLFTSAATIQKRLDVLERELDLDSGRALRWTFAQAVLSAIWAVEDGHPIEATTSFIRLAHAVRAMLR